MTDRIKFIVADAKYILTFSPDKNLQEAVKAKDEAGILKAIRMLLPNLNGAVRKRALNALRTPGKAH